MIGVTASLTAGVRPLGGAVLHARGIRRVGGSGGRGRGSPGGCAARGGLAESGPGSQNRAMKPAPGGAFEVMRSGRALAWREDGRSCAASP